MSSNSKFPFWDTSWFQNQNQQVDWFQNQIMDAWASFNQFNPGAASAVNPMQQAMESWWQQASGSLSGQGQDFYSKMMQQGQAFYFMGEQFSKLIEGLKQTSNNSEEWISTLNDHFKSMESMIENMQGTFMTQSLMAEAFSNDYSELGQITSFFEKFLSMQGVGPDRENQAQTQEGIKLFNEYQKVSGEYNAVLSKVGVEALEAMRNRIIEMANQEQEINSLRQVYDLWVDCNENAYAELVYTDEYSELYGRYINAGLALKKHNNEVLEGLLAKLNIPSRQGMNSALKRVQELKRAQHSSAARIDSLEKEIQELRELVGEKKKPVAAKKVSKKTSTRTAKKPVAKAAKKKVAKKKAKKKAAKKKSGNKSIVIDI